ncbi:TetR/AcrR family transcriptional regulator [Ideonella sp. 4Y16]|uniref:TetR/AcrR family transcriptional regulator n=1 Tax=Ideonella alba TaxID=2824118 RepID=A0A941BGP2_9BURK|nr:TetR/AcrR family transcriptional regulator [Ideonella alba]MBQ0933226.1 TetR/AcrR family transcriptional regulator [Ideonella alba]MBQ0944697.1 TetR/AcrR family transcriptional regulator [Ideonella alba]
MNTAAAPARRAAASAKSEQRIRDILRVGREVFAEKGYERATTIEIAQRLGISEATVFTYFSGKRELCVRVLGDWYDEIIAAMQANLPRERSVREQLMVFVETHLRLFLIHGTGLCALVLSEGRSRGQALGESFLPLQRRYTAPLMDLLARGQASGEVRADVPLRLLRPMVLGPMEHILWEVVGQPDKPLDLAATARAVGEMAWSAIAAPEAELAALRALRSELRDALARSGA